METRPIAQGEGLRERKKAQTRRALQEHALRLFLAHGYDAVPVSAIAEAVGVSTMTFFRYFPTKEDVILSDEYDAVLVEAIRSQPPDVPLVEAVRTAIAAGFRGINGDERHTLFLRTQLILQTPALRARLWEQQVATEHMIAQALTARQRAEPPTIATRVGVAACLAAVTTALMIWVEGDGQNDITLLINAAFGALVRTLGADDDTRD